jgi:hypothetical protein
MRPDPSDALVSHARAEGAVSTDEAMRLLGVSRATAQRRLRELVAEQRLARKGAGRGARYVLPSNRWERQLADVFRRWTDPDTLAFDRTRTTVRLAGFGVQLLSRSEARRVTVGLEPFRHVTIDFAGVDMVGQGFCDEVFRVFAAAHPQIELATVGMNESVAFMVERARRKA